MSGIFVRAGCVVAAVVAVGLLASGEAVPQAIKPPQTLQETGLYADFAAVARRPGPPRIRAAISALDRRRDQAALDFAPAGHGDRRVGSGCMGFSGRHAAVEGILLRRPADRDALPRAQGRRAVALRRLCVEPGWPRSDARARTRQAQCLRARRRTRAHDPRRQRLQGVPSGRPQRGARLQRAAALARARSECAARRGGRPASICAT